MGRSFTAVTLIVLVTVLLAAAPALSEFASVTCQLMVRVVLVLSAVGSSLVELNVTERSAVV